jgi:hypothetical protein
MDRKQTFERSNAFADGELDQQGRSDVLKDAAEDSRLARELSNLERLKSAISDSVDAPDLDLAAMTGKHGGHSSWRRPVMAMAACLVLFVAAGLAWSVIGSGVGSGRSNHGVPVAWAIGAHNSWANEDAPSQSQAQSRAVKRPANARLNAHVPDLSAAKLHISHIGESQTLDGLPAMVIGYRGTRGCRVTLLIDGSQAEPGGKAVFFKVDKLIAMVWQAGSLRHVILAEGMAEARFRLIAETVRRTSLERLPVDDATRMALAQSREKNPPCAA